MAGATVQTIQPDNIYQGTRYPLEFRFGVDVSASAFKSQLRRYASSPTVAAEFTFTVTNATTGIVLAVLSAAQTSALAPGPYVWDIDWEQVAGDPETTLAVCRAEIIVEGEVTR
jgi:hypothetical protein